MLASSSRASTVSERESRSDTFSGEYLTVRTVFTLSALHEKEEDNSSEVTASVSGVSALRTMSMTLPVFTACAALSIVRRGFAPATAAISPNGTCILRTATPLSLMLSSLTSVGDWAAAMALILPQSAPRVT